MQPSAEGPGPGGEAGSRRPTPLFRPNSCARRTRCLAWRGGGSSEQLPRPQASARAALSVIAAEVRPSPVSVGLSICHQPVRRFDRLRPACDRYASSPSTFLGKRNRPSCKLMTHCAVRTRSRAGARILEFPRSAAAPAPVLDELAEPVMDRPRILEVPELVLPPPALGGILIEPVEEPAKERRPGFELPLQAAPMSRRLLAGGNRQPARDYRLCGFCLHFLRITSIVPALPQAAGDLRLP